VAQQQSSALLSLSWIMAEVVNTCKVEVEGMKGKAGMI
jgi:hypothetical protein